jgi:hypothetical protein
MAQAKLKQYYDLKLIRRIKTNLLFFIFAIEKNPPTLERGSKKPPMGGL